MQNAELQMVLALGCGIAHGRRDFRNGRGRQEGCIGVVKRGVRGVKRGMAVVKRGLQGCKTRAGRRDDELLEMLIIKGGGVIDWERVGRDQRQVTAGNRILPLVRGKASRIFALWAWRGRRVC